MVLLIEANNLIVRVKFADLAPSCAGPAEWPHCQRDFFTIRVLDRRARGLPKLRAPITAATNRNALPSGSSSINRSGGDEIDGTKKIHLADIDAVVTEDGIGHRNMKKGVGDRHLQQVVLATDDLAGQAKENLTLRSLAPAYCASFTLSAKATVLRMRARTSSIVCSLSSCLGGVCPESQAAAALT